MDGQDDQQLERQTVMQHAYRAELVERIGQAVREDGVAEPLPGLHLARSSVPFQLIHSVVEPSICVIAQGSKEVLLGESRYRYDPDIICWLLSSCPVSVKCFLPRRNILTSVFAWTWPPPLSLPL